MAEREMEYVTYPSLEQCRQAGVAHEPGPRMMPGWRATERQLTRGRF